jgi:hypothetical protein
MLCVIEAPSVSTSSSFYLMSIQHLLSLASFAMLVSLGESTMGAFVALLSQRGGGESAKLYYAAAKREMEDDAPRHREMHTAIMDVCANLNVMLKKHSAAVDSDDDKDSSRSAALTV